MPYGCGKAFVNRFLHFTANEPTTPSLDLDVASIQMRRLAFTPLIPACLCYLRLAAGLDVLRVYADAVHFMIEMW